MKRILIFLSLFPAVATITFYAAIYLLTGAAVDSVSGPAFMYLLLALPALLVALLDWWMAKLAMPVVFVTSGLTYALSAAVLAGLLGVSGQIPVLALIGAIPAAVCSWISRSGATVSVKVQQV